MFTILFCMFKIYKEKTVKTVKKKDKILKNDNKNKTTRSRAKQKEKKTETETHTCTCHGAL